MKDLDFYDYPDYCPKTGYQACSECPDYNSEKDCCTNESSEGGYTEVCE